MTARKTLVDIRYCEHCGWIIPRRPYDGPSGYKKKRFCTLKCAAVSMAEGKRKFTENYYTLHWRVRMRRGAASTYKCEHCADQAYDWAWIHDRDGQDPFDFMPLCRACHVTYDDIPVRANATRKRNGTPCSEETRAAMSRGAAEFQASLTSEQKTEIKKRAWATRRAKMEKR